MTRIAGVPEQLRTAAALMAGGAPELDLAASVLASAQLPQMPPSVASSVEDTMWQAAATLRAAAAVAEAQALDLKRRGLWLEVAGTAFATWTDGMFGRTAATTPLDALDLLSRRRAVTLSKIWGRYESRVIPYVADEGEFSEGAALRKLFFFAREQDRLKSYDRFKFMVAKAGDLDVYDEASGVPLAAVREFSGRWLGPLGVVGGLIEIGLPEHHGWEGVGDRISGGATAVGSALSTYTTVVGLEAATAAIPGVDVIAGALLLGSAGWEMYTHRKAIAHLVVAGGGYLLHHPVVLAGPAGIAAEQVWDHRRQIAHTAVATATWGEHRLEDAAEPALSVAHGALHEGGKLLGKIGL